MDYLWTPWRYRYIADAAKDEGCVFCASLALKDDSASLIVFRGAKNFVILNRYPYTSGHVMIVPYVHSADLQATDAETLAEMIGTTRSRVSFFLNRFRELGFIDYSAGNMQVHSSLVSVVLHD